MLPYQDQQDKGLLTIWKSLTSNSWLFSTLFYFQFVIVIILSLCYVFKVHSCVFTVLAAEVGPDGALSVELLKTSAGLGFSLEGGKASAHGDRPLYIKRIFRGKHLPPVETSDLHQGAMLLLVYTYSTSSHFENQLL